MVLQCQPAFGAPAHHARQTQGHIGCQAALAADQALQGGSRNLQTASQFADGDGARFEVEPLKELAGMGWVLLRVYGFTRPDCVVAIEALMG